MNILLAIESLETGGAEIFVKNLAKALAAKHRVFILLTASRQTALKINIPGVTLINPLRVGVLNKLLSQFYWFYKFNFFLQLVQFHYLIYRHRIHVIHSHLFHTDFKIFKWLGGIKMPWVITMHGCYESYLFRGEGETHVKTVNELYRKRMQQLLARVNYVTMASEKNRLVFDYLSARPQTEVINLGVPLAPAGKRVVDTDEFVQKKWVMGMVSRGLEAKGWDVAIESFLNWRMTSQKNESELRLVYSETAYMQELQARYKHEPSVRFLGYKSDVLAEMCQMDVLLFPSRFASESQPITIIEAMSVGLPVIATAIGEIPRMLSVQSNPSGICVDADVAPSLQVDLVNNALNKLTIDCEYYIGRVENSYINFRIFSIEASAEKFVNIYGTLITDNI